MSKSNDSKKLSIIEKKFEQMQPVKCVICDEEIPNYEEDKILYSETKRKSVLFFHAKCAKNR